MSVRSAGQPIKVLIVEDSLAQRELLVGLIDSTAGFAVVGTAGNGREALGATQRLAPDVIAMDINLPGLDGYEATLEIMRHCPTPVVMVSSAAGDDQRSIQALAVGALAVVRKPRSLLLESSAADRATLLTTLRLMADVRVVTRHAGRRTDTPAPAAPIAPPLLRPRVVAIAASTGGPAALQTLLVGLGADLGLPILIAQHIARGFVGSLVEWLGGCVPQQVHVAVDHERLLPNHVYFAPEDRHLALAAPGVIELRPVAESDRFCPSADTLLQSVAEVYGMRAIGIVLTGMGEDGACGLRALCAAGGQTLAQDEASSVVYGMPKAALALGAVRQGTALPHIAPAVRRLSGAAA